MMPFFFLGQLDNLIRRPGPCHWHRASVNCVLCGSIRWSRYALAGVSIFTIIVYLSIAHRGMSLLIRS